MKKILIVFGTRPEAIKMVPLIKEFKKYNDFEVKICVSAQHRQMLDQVLNLFEIKPDYDLDIMKANQDLYDISSRVLLGMRDVMKDFCPNVVLVHGDTTTSFVGALAAFYQKIKIGHDFIKKQGFSEVDILWFDSPLFGYLLDVITYKKSILRIADYSKGFNSVSSAQFNTEINIANKVDVVIYTAKNLKEKYFEIKDKSKMKYVPNGIDLDFFKAADRCLPQELEDIPRPRVIYVGAIHDWFDVDLVHYCAKNLPNYSFIIIGPEHKDLSLLRKLKNVHILGAISYDKIPAFLYNSQVGIIPFNVKDYPALVNSINPLKMYEYLACGLKVVSVEWEQIKDMNDIINLTTKKDEFVDAIEHGNSLEYDLLKLTWFEILGKFLKDMDV